jgi:hypothetical protein
MSMTSTAVLAIVLLTLGLVLFALLDLVRATDMDMGARAIVAAALIFAAPLGLLLWLFVRGGRTGALVAAAMVAVALFVVLGVAVTSNRGVHVVESSSTGSFSVSSASNSATAP